MIGADKVRHVERCRSARRKAPGHLRKRLLYSRSFMALGPTANGLRGRVLFSVAA